ncbi:MAG TPA: diacylglycerol kinase family protein [Thermoanaerobaculia bacterium]|nr:diacylglycerol kinase family protein [Thermoanaerobaculia bacterium]
MPSSKGTLFFNPSSGVKVPAAELLAFQEAAREAGLDVIRLTREVNCAETIRERMERGQRLFIAAGGDGTINHVMQPLVHTEAVLGVIPAGTYNHFARDLGIPLDWRQALEVALTGALQQIDTGRINDRFFVNNVSLGLYPELVAKREERGRDYPRWKARFWAAYHIFRKYPHVTVTVETEHHHDVLRTHVFMVSNNSYDLSRVGIEAPRATLSEGRLSVYWLPHLRRLALMRFAAQYLAGRVREAPGFRSFRTARMKVQTPRDHLHLGIDGEVLTMQTPLVITTVPQSLVVRVPRT